MNSYCEKEKCETTTKYTDYNQHKITDDNLKIDYDCLYGIYRFGAGAQTNELTIQISLIETNRSDEEIEGRGKR